MNDSSARDICHVFLFRHGETDWNLEGRLQGHLDIPLNETGRKQARELASSLSTCNLELIVSSDLVRASETARIVAETLRVNVELSSGLREAHLGTAQNLLIADVDSRFGTGTWQAWSNPLEEFDDMSFPGGESKRVVMLRSRRVLEELCDRFRTKSPIGISIHGFVLSCLLRDLADEMKPFSAIGNGVVFHLLFDRLGRKWERAQILQKK